MRALLRRLCQVQPLLFLSVAQAWGWSCHDAITHFSLQAYEGWPVLNYQPIEAVLPALTVDGSSLPKSLRSFADQLKIQRDKIRWDWMPTMQMSARLSHAIPRAIDVLEYSILEADEGMDQNLDLSPDQRFMGGYTGPASQGIRHMYYQAFSILEPLVTLHYPFHEMGFAPARAELFFKLAVASERSGHSFWAHRFLGWGMHYVQDMGQPYHATQFASLRFLPLLILIKEGWAPFIEETTRIVANFHLAFEQYFDFILSSSRDDGLVLALSVPKANKDLKWALEQKENLPIQQGVKILAKASAQLAPDLAASQDAFMGAHLRRPEFDLRKEPKDSHDGARLDFAALEHRSGLERAKKRIQDAAFEALSNIGIATRWYYDRFKAAIATR